MKNAFTLIELLVVVLIVGILAAIALPQYQKAVDKARLAEGLIMAKAIKEAQQRHHLANGVYTQDFSALDIEIPGNCVPVAELPGEVLCGPGKAITLTVVPSVYVHIAAGAGIEYYYNSDTRLCFGGIKRWYDVCQSMGGVVFYDDTIRKYYKLP